MSKTNYTRALRRAQEQGARIVCSVAPYEGQPVIYDTGHARSHPQPWLVPGTGIRYSGRECRAEGPYGGSWTDAKPLYT